MSQRSLKSCNAWGLLQISVVSFWPRHPGYCSKKLPPTWLLVVQSQVGPCILAGVISWFPFRFKGGQFPHAFHPCTSLLLQHSWHACKSFHTDGLEKSPKYHRETLKPRWHLGLAHWAVRREQTWFPLWLFMPVLSTLVLRLFWHPGSGGSACCAFSPHACVWTYTSLLVAKGPTLCLPLLSLQQALPPIKRHSTPSQPPGRTKKGLLLDKDASQVRVKPEPPTPFLLHVDVSARSYAIEDFLSNFALDFPRYFLSR